MVQDSFIVTQQCWRWLSSVQLKNQSTINNTANNKVRVVCINNVSADLAEEYVQGEVYRWT